MLPVHNVQKIQEKNNTDKASVINVNTWAIWENGEFCVLFLQLFYKSEVISKKKERMWKLPKSPLQSVVLWAGPGWGVGSPLGAEQKQCLEPFPSLLVPWAASQCPEWTGLRTGSLSALLGDMPSPSSLPVGVHDISKSHQVHWPVWLSG